MIANIILFVSLLALSSYATWVWAEWWNTSEWPWKLRIVSRQGKPYMTRWMLFPRNPVFNLYLHHFVEGDDVLHDHPYCFVAIRLRGDAWEETINHTGDRTTSPIRWWPRVYMGRGFHAIAAAHNFWTLCIIGPTYRTWGVIDEDGEWRPFYSSIAQWKRNHREYSQVKQREEC